jgi:VIT1/CCC1 family predicted Fe2+/Mn2+ transporter
MTSATHIEKHFMSSDIVRDIVIGMSDGLTVPFAIAAGMSGASVAAKIVITAGLAEIVAGSISMGLGGYLAGRTDVEHYESEQKREEHEVDVIPEQEAQEVADIFRNLGMEEEEITPVVNALRKDRAKWVDFMMRFELGLEAPDPRRAMQSAITIAASYAISGFIPLGPYILIKPVSSALYISAAVTLLALFVFGYVKGRITGLNAFRSAWQMMLIGGIAAGTAFAVARLI